MLKMLLRGFDWFWNIRGLTGYRSRIAQAVGGGLAIYQELATSQQVIDAIHIDLPDVPVGVYLPLVAYFSAKVIQFASEHKPKQP